MNYELQKRIYPKVVVIIHYNTPQLTAACIRSLEKHTPGTHVIVFDNSNKRPFVMTEGLTGIDIEIIDNTRGQLIDFDAWLKTFPNREPSPGNDYGSAKHCYSVQWIMDHRKRPFMLMDSDVLIRKDISPLFDTDYVWIGHVGNNTKRRFGFEVKKVDPFLCYINMPMVRAYGIRYFNGRKMWNLVSKMPESRYDTGAWFYEDCDRHHLPTKDVDVKKEYIHHLGHGSWRDKDPMAWLEKYKELWA